MAKLTRRMWLGGAAAGGIAAALPLPWLDTFGAPARAQAGAPKRFIAVMGALGIKMRRWVTGTPGSYSFGPGLAALRPYQSDITVLRGVQPKIGSHTGSTACFLSGDGLANNAAKHATIDQMIAQANPPGAAAGSGRIVKSIQAGVGVRGTDGRSTLVYEAAGSPLHPKNNPAQLFDELFAGAAPTGPDPSARLDAEADAQQSILDAHLAELSVLYAKGSRQDQLRLEEHLDGLRSIETDVQMFRSGGVSIAECTNPTRYDAASVIGAAPYDRIAESHCEIIGRAFACDITRVATLQLFYDASGGIGLNFLDGRSSGISAKSVHDNKHAQGVASDTIDDWYAEMVAHLLSQLDVTDPLDPNGGRILDNTVLLFGSNLPNPAHGAGPNYGFYRNANEQDTTDTAYLLAGSAGGYFNTGRMLDFRQLGLYYGENGNKYTSGDGHVFANRLLISLVNAFGISTSTVGDSAFCTGGALDGGLIR
ncbi:MAG: DUF1552 domain-containing protein [Sandaracinaceae bacterium]